jgi:hypothetical protein
VIREKRTFEKAIKKAENFLTIGRLKTFDTSN